MSTSVQRRQAEQIYNSGRALFDQGLYHEALLELHRAENAFRELDARGHPLSHPLPNGISGLANVLALSGRCCQKLGNHRAAVTYYETSLINEKFEKKKPFRAFIGSLNKDMAFCYQKMLEAVPNDERESMLARDPEIDVSFRFPYSLSPDTLPIARLYELAPDSHGSYRRYYEQARALDLEIRRSIRGTDASTVIKLSLSVWGLLAAVWAVYAFIVIRALTK